MRQQSEDIVDKLRLGEDVGSDYGELLTAYCQFLNSRIPKVR